jgi:hypothetical protein
MNATLHELVTEARTLFEEALEETKDAPPDVQGFMNALKETVTKHFPKGYFRINAQRGKQLYMRTATLPAGKQSNAIIENDPAYQTYWFWNAFTAAGLKPKIRVEMSQGGRLYGPNMSDPKKIGWRNKTGTPDQVIKHFDKYYAKLKKMVRENVQEACKPKAGEPNIEALDASYAQRALEMITGD